MLIKSKQDITNLKKSGAIMGEILAELAKRCRPGMSSWEIDRVAEEMIIKAGGRPAFKGYQTTAASYPFPSTICASFNEELVHGIPRHERVLKDGDIFSIDIGMEWPAFASSTSSVRPRAHGREVGASMGKARAGQGVITDTAITVAVGSISDEAQKLLAVTKQALEEGIKAAQPGNSVASIGKAIETYVKSQGKYGIVRDLVGHGVGHNVHEDPYIPNYYDRALEAVKLEPGMVIAIEPMISLGGHKVVTMADGWTIKTADNSPSAHFEHTIIITKRGNVVATRRPDEK